MSEWQEITTLAELDALDDDEVVAGYREARRGDPEPGNNRSRSYWHGWRMRMNDLGATQATATHQALVRAAVARERAP